MKIGTFLMASSTSSFAFQMLILVAFIVLMYFLLVRPQKKKEKTVNEMRNSLRVGDEIITIGGICGKIVKTKDQSLIIQVGADKTKFEVMRWSISSVTSKSKKGDQKGAGGLDEDEESEVRTRKSSPKRLKKAKSEEPAEKKDAKAEKAPVSAEEKGEAAVKEDASGTDSAADSAAEK